MKLTKTEETKVLTEGALIVAVFIAVLVGSILGGKHLVEVETKDKKTVMEANANILLDNIKDAKEIKQLRENQSAIDSAWSKLKSSGAGVNSSTVGVLVQAGISDIVILPPTRVPGNPIEYSGVRIGGDKTEFQKLLDSISTLENQEFLLQIRNCTIQLPNTTIPDSPKPTYLNTIMEVVGPISK